MENADKKFDSLTLRFIDEENEKDFEKILYLSSVKGLKVVLVTSIFLFAVFFLLDFLLYEGHTDSTLIIRICLISVLTSVLGYLQFFDQSVKSIQVSVNVAIASAFFALCAISLIPHETIHIRTFPGLLMLTIFNTTFVRQKFVNVVASQALIFVFSTLMFAMKPQASQVDVVWAGFYLLGTSLLGIFYSYLLELYLRKNYLYKQKVNRQHRDILVKNENLNRLNEEKMDMFRWVIHDLRTPLNIILNYAQIIDNKTTGLDKEISKVLKSTEKINQMVGNLLQTSVLESGSLELRKQEHDLSSIVKNIVEECMIFAEKKDIHIDLKVSDSLVVNIDETQIRMILDNLISNAIKYTPQSSEVSVVLHENTSGFRFEVSDQGCGIPEDEVDKLFKKFGKTSNRPTGGENSSGLGLYIVKKSVTLMGGKVGYIRNQPSGSIFWVEIPADSATKKMAS